jgi:hypothetical protein
MNRLAIDTNVLVVANEQNDQVSLWCLENSISAVSNAMLNGVVLVDSTDCVVEEYLRAVDTRRRPQNAGGRFLLWLLENRYSDDRVKQIDIPKDHAGHFTDCPPKLNASTFDISDRKFVALAVKGMGCVLNATDSDWCEHATLLSAGGVRVTNLCGCDKDAIFGRE